MAPIPRRFLLAALLAAFAPGVAAQEFPSRPITIVVPFPPGGSADVLMRVVGDRLADVTKQTVIIENRPGGGGSVAALMVKQAAPDGYTVFMGHAGTQAVNPALYPDLKYDPIKDFQPITTIMSFPSVLVVPVASPAKSVAELAALAKSKPGGLTFASQGVGAGGHLLGEMFKRAVGAPMIHVPYRGAAAAVTDVMTGRVDFMFVSYISAAAYIQDGRLRMLGLTSAKRSATVPQVPTMAEAGFPGIEMETWFGMLTPIGLPAPILQKLHADFVKAAHQPEVTRMVTSQAADLITSTPQEFSALIAADAARLGKFVREAGIKGE